MTNSPGLWIVRAAARAAVFLEQTLRAWQPQGLPLHFILQLNLMDYYIIT